MSEHEQPFISGHWVPPRGSELLAVTSPATAETIGSVPLGAMTDIDTAVAAAWRALEYSPWPRMTVEEQHEVHEIKTVGLPGDHDPAVFDRSRSSMRGRWEQSMRDVAQGRPSCKCCRQFVAYHRLDRSQIIFDHQSRARSQSTLPSRSGALFPHGAWPSPRSR